MPLPLEKDTQVKNNIKNAQEKFSLIYFCPQGNMYMLLTTQATPFNYWLDTDDLIIAFSEEVGK